MRGWPQLRGLVRAAALLALGCAMAGCAGGPQGFGTASGPMAAMASVRGSAQTVSFESIDGPPPQVFDRFVRVLDTESQSRDVAIVSRSAAAGYRVRSYLSAQVRGGRTVIAWVWDVYDSDQQRALRLSGEEAAGRAGRDAWAAADDQLLRRIAQSGLIGLSGFVNGTAPPDPQEPASPSGRGPAIASIADEAAAPGSAVALGFSSH
jgi:hypothetical protein